MTKAELPFTNFKVLMKLHAKNGVLVSPTYANEVGCANMIARICEVLEDYLCKNVQNARYISVLCDGATDNDIVENEVVCVRVVLEGRACTKFVAMVPVQHA